VFTVDAVIDYSSAGFTVGSLDEVVDALSAGFGALPWSMHYITNIEVLESDGDGRRLAQR
jgi:hypothetical protein